MSPDILSVSIRAFGFVLLFQAIGAAFFAALFGSIVDTGSLRRILKVSAIGGAVVIGVHLALEATRLTGEFSGLVNMAMQHRVLASASAIAHLLQIVGLAVIAWGARERQRFVVASVGGVLAIAGFLFVGHTSVSLWRVVLWPLLMLHLLIVAFWFGSLLPLCIVVKNDALLTTKIVLARFSALATWLVPMIAIMGLILVLIIAEGWPSIREPYGQLIAVKLIGFATLMILAALNKWRLVPAIESNATQSRKALQRSMITEYLLIVVVLAATAIMTTFFSPGE